MRRRGLLLAFSGFLIMACQSGYTTKEYLTWASTDEGGLSVIQKYEPIEFRAKYIPSDFQCLLQNRRFLDDPDTLEKLAVGYANQLFFTFDMYVNNGGQKASVFTITRDDQEYANLNRYLMESGTQFKLLIGKDTLRPAYTHLERTYDLTPYNTVHLAFELPGSIDRTSGFELYYEDDWFNNGRMKFKWSEKTIKNIPSLNYSQL